MASWFTAVLGLLAFANGVGLAVLAVQWTRLPGVLGGRPLPAPADLRQLLPFVLGLLLVLVA